MGWLDICLENKLKNYGLVNDNLIPIGFPTSIVISFRPESKLQKTAYNYIFLKRLQKGAPATSQGYVV